MVSERVVGLVICKGESCHCAAGSGHNGTDDLIKHQSDVIMLFLLVYCLMLDNVFLL